jgi:uncharacterized cysteine cluster protein YcgN (CxxCxxCC family)
LLSHDPNGQEVAVNDAEPPFWQTKSLEEMTQQEWESLCDGCARCCLVKLEDEDTGKTHLTRLGCSLLDIGACRCHDYDARHVKMPDCVPLDAEAVRTLEWLPQTCAYRRIAEGDELAWWHPLVSGSDQTVHEAAVSVRSWALSESKVAEPNYHRYIIRRLPGP